MALNCVRVDRSYPNRTGIVRDRCLHRAVQNGRAHMTLWAARDDRVSGRTGHIPQRAVSSSRMRAIARAAFIDSPCARLRVRGATGANIGNINGRSASDLVNRPGRSGIGAVLNVW